MPSCCVSNCRNRYTNGRTFHRFPRTNMFLREKWISGIAKGHHPGWRPIHTSRICSDHFEDVCFDRSGNHVLLLPNAVPTKFEFLPGIGRQRPLPGMSKESLHPEIDSQCLWPFIGKESSDMDNVAKASSSTRLTKSSAQRAIRLAKYKQLQIDHNYTFFKYDDVKRQIARYERLLDSKEQKLRKVRGQLTSANKTIEELSTQIKHQKQLNNDAGVLIHNFYVELMADDI